MSGWGKGVGGRAARVWAAALAGVFLAVGVTHRDVEAVAFGVLTALALLASHFRRGLLGRIGLGLLSVDTLVWMVPALVANLSTGDAVSSVLVPALLSLLSLGLLLLVVGVRPRPVLALGAAGIIATAAGSLAVTARDDPPPTAGRTVTMRNVAFLPAKVETSAGEAASIAIRNRDLFWHTFTVPSLDIDVAVPTGATRVVTVDAPAGVYEFVCAIPGHEGAGMKGSLTVR